MIFKNMPTKHKEDESESFKGWLIDTALDNASKYIKSQQDILNFYISRLNSMITILNAISLAIFAACVAYFNSHHERVLPNYLYYIFFVIGFCIVCSGLHIWLALKKQNWGIEAIEPSLIKKTEYKMEVYVKNDILEAQMENINTNNATLSVIFINLRRAWAYLLLMPSLSCTFLLIFILFEQFSLHGIIDFFVFLSFFLFQALIYL